jgi:hypothetical protein
MLRCLRHRDSNKEKHEEDRAEYRGCVLMLSTGHAWNGNCPPADMTMHN